jgi:hypothetical protein
MFDEPFLHLTLNHLQGSRLRVVIPSVPRAFNNEKEENSVAERTRPLAKSRRLWTD